MLKLPPPVWALAYTLIVDGRESRVCRSCGPASFSLS
jgi:hypothetical protein